MSNELPDWTQFMPGTAAAKAGAEGLIEHEAVRRIIVGSGMTTTTAQVLLASKTNPPRLTFDGLVEAAGFPVKLYGYKMTQQEVRDTMLGLDRRITKTPLFEAFSELSGDDDWRGLAFHWYGSGQRICVFHNASTQHLGSRGRYWRIDDAYYYMEPLDSFIARLGPPDLW